MDYVQNCITNKLGKVNQKVVSELSLNRPNREELNDLLKSISRQHKVKWDASLLLDNYPANTLDDSKAIEVPIPTLINLDSPINHEFPSLPTSHKFPNNNSTQISGIENYPVPDVPYFNDIPSFKNISPTTSLPTVPAYPDFLDIPIQPHYNTDLLNLDLPDVPYSIQKNKPANINLETDTTDLDLPSVPTFSPLNTTTSHDDSLFEELNQRLLGLKPQNSGTIGDNIGFHSATSPPDTFNDLDLPSVPQLKPTTFDNLDMDLPSPPLGFTRSVVAYSFKPDLNPIKKEENPDEDELFSRFSKLRK